MEGEILACVAIFLVAICTLAVVIGLLQDRVSALEARLDHECSCGSIGGFHDPSCPLSPFYEEGGRDQ